VNTIRLEPCRGPRGSAAATSQELPGHMQLKATDIVRRRCMCRRGHTNKPRDQSTPWDNPSVQIPHFGGVSSQHHRPRFTHQIQIDSLQVIEPQTPAMAAEHSGLMHESDSTYTRNGSLVSCLVFAAYHSATALLNMRQRNTSAASFRNSKHERMEGLAMPSPLPPHRMWGKTSSTRCRSCGN
jgi:hypothetical protein